MVDDVHLCDLLVLLLSIVLVDAVPVHPEVAMAQPFGDGNGILDDPGPRERVGKRSAWDTPNVAESDKCAANGGLDYNSRLTINQAKAFDFLGPLPTLVFRAHRSVILGAKVYPVTEEAKISQRRDLSRIDAAAGDV